MTFYETVLPSSGTRAQNIRLYRNRVSPGHRPLIHHSHPSLELGLFEDFYGTYTLRDREYSIQPGDVFLFRSNEEHYVTSIDSDHDLECVGLHFSPEFIWSPSDPIFDMHYMYVFSEQNRSFENLLPRRSAMTARVRKLLHLIEAEFQEKKPEYPLMIKMNLIEILILIIRQYPEQDLEQMKTRLSVKRDTLARLESVMEYINNHLSEPMKLDELAAIAKMSPSYFSQLFKSVNGFSTWDYIISRRIDMAQTLLSTTDQSVLDIAFQCGFNNSTNFNRAFKKITSFSPKEYRNR